MTDQPKKVCIQCGLRYRKDMPRPSDVTIYEVETCDVCGCKKVCTDPGQFGGLKDEWKQHGRV